MLKCFIVDTGHIKGLEVHCINEYGLIYIYNLNSEKLVTIINPRPKQIKRYFQALDIHINEDIQKVITLSYKRNQENNLNKLK